MTDAFTRVKVSYIYSQKEKHCAPQGNVSLRESAARQGEDLVKKLLLRWQGQPHRAQPELHLGKYRLQQLLREQYGKGQAFSETSPPATLPASQLTVVQGLSASELTSLHLRKWMWSYRARRAILFLRLVS